MGRTVHLSVLGDPVALARARLGRGGRWYTPAKSVEAEQQIGLAWKATGEVAFLVGQPLALEVIALCASPQKPKHCYPPRPDADNVLKLVADALQKAGAFSDDSQIVEWHCQKVYAGEGVAPGLNIILFSMDDLSRRWAFHAFHVSRAAFTSTSCSCSR